MSGQQQPKAQKFLLPERFSARRRKPRPRRNREALAAAEQREREEGYAQGLEEGRARADSALQHVLERIAADASALLACVMPIVRPSRRGLAFATALAEKLAGDAMKRYTMDAIAQLRTASFRAYCAAWSASV